MTDLRQDQKASEGAIAIQSARDTTIINAGITANDMRLIMEAIALQSSTFAAVAREVADDRMKIFETKMLEKFAKGNEEANAEAFKDPDFQYLLGRAQHAYARSGDEATRDTLVDLIARRSKEQQRGRLALTLNEAVEKSAVLTKNEFAELSLCYLLRYTRRISIVDKASFNNYLKTSVLPLLSDISREQASYQYLVAQSCASISLNVVTAAQLFRQTYQGLFWKGFAKNQLIPGLPPERSQFVHDSKLVIPCLNDAERCQLSVINQDTFSEFAKTLGLTEGEISTIWSFQMTTAMTDQEVMQHIETDVPEIRDFEDLWDKTSLSHLELTTVGIAIGYANAVRVTGFQGDLGIWIK